MHSHKHTSTFEGEFVFIVFLSPASSRTTSSSMRLCYSCSLIQITQEQSSGYSRNFSSILCHLLEDRIIQKNRIVFVKYSSFVRRHICCHFVVFLHPLHCIESSEIVTKRLHFLHGVLAILRKSCLKFLLHLLVASFRF